MAVGGSGGGTIANLQVRVGADVAAALLGFATLQGAISGVVDAIKGFISSGIEMNSFLESSELQFKTLTGSATAAHDKVSDLFDLAAHSPFTFESVTVAARQLEVFGGAALDTHDNLVLLGDAAAATGASVQEVTFWTGRLYADLQAGKPIGEASRWLQRMGVLSAEARVHMEALSEAGASGNDIWAAFVESQQRFGGAMKAQEKTWEGLTSTIRDQLTLLEGVATRGLFTNLEGQMRGLSDALADPRAQQGAERLGAGLGAVASAAEFVVGSHVNTAITVLEGLNAAIEKTEKLADQAQRGTFLGLKPPVDMPTTTSGGIMAGIDAARTYSHVAGDVAAAQAATNRVLGAAQAAGDGASRGYDHARASAEALRDESLRAAEASHILAQQHQDSYAQMTTQEEALALMRRHVQSENTDVLADLHQREAQDAIRHAQEAADAQAKAARDAAKAQEDAAREATRVQQEQARAMQEAVSRAYVDTADEAVAQYQRIANAAPAPADTLQQEIDEATNRQVREGIAGTADAEKQLDDIRKAHLATLPDLVALDKQYADAQRDAHTADLAVAAAERDLKVALAATGGQQTLQTAALAHNVTAAKQAADAAHDHAAALSAERSQAISDTNALKGLSGATEDVAAASKSLPDMGSDGAFSTLSTGAVVATREMDALKLSLKGYQKELDLMQEQANSIDLITQRAGVAGQASDLATSEQTLQMRRDLLPLQQRMDELRLAREATDNKGKQKSLDKDIADTQLRIDAIQSRISAKQRENQARALDAEQAMIPIERQRLAMEDAILGVKQQQLAAQLDMNNAQRMFGAAGGGLPPGWIKNADGSLSPPTMQLTDHGWQTQPQRNIQFNFNGNVVTTQQSFDQAVINAVQQADRQSALNLTRYAPR